MNAAVFARKTLRVWIPVLALAVPLAVRAQQTASPHAVTPSPSGTDSSTSETTSLGNTQPLDPAQARMMKDMMKERNVLRQKQIVTDTDHLLDLARQLKDAVDKSSKDELSLDVVNTASEIEKLAKSVKEKMRDGQ